MGQRLEVCDQDMSWGQEEKEGLGHKHTDICANRELNWGWGCRLLKGCRGTSGAEKGGLTE